MYLLVDALTVIDPVLLTSATAPNFCQCFSWCRQVWSSPPKSGGQEVLIELFHAMQDVWGGGGRNDRDYA
jgi:hypothetical protein